MYTKTCVFFLARVRARVHAHYSRKLLFLDCFNLLTVAINFHCCNEITYLIICIQLKWTIRLFNVNNAGDGDGRITSYWRQELHLGVTIISINIKWSLLEISFRNNWIPTISLLNAGFLISCILILAYISVFIIDTGKNGLIRFGYYAKWLDL